MSDDPFLAALGGGGAAPRAAAPAIPSGQTLATRNNNPGNIRDSAFARSQPGYAGSEKGFAKFADPDSGRNAQLSLLQSYTSRGINTPAAIARRWAPPNENDTARYAATIAQDLGIGINDPVPVGKLHVIAGAQDRLEGYNGPSIPGMLDQPADPHDPFLNALNGGNGAGNGGLPSAPGQVAPDRRGDVAVLHGAGPVPGVAGPQTAPQSGATASRIGQSATDLAQGFLHGISTVPKTIGSAFDWGARHLGVGQPQLDASGQQPTSHLFNSILPAWLAPAANILAAAKPADSAEYAAGRFGGEAAATLPLADVKLLDATRLATGGKLAEMLAKYGNYSIQGAGAGALTSEGNNVGDRAAFGALAAPVLGSTVEHVVAPLLMKIPGAQMLVDALTGKNGAAPEPPAVPQAAPVPSQVDPETLAGLNAMSKAGKPYSEAEAFAKSRGAAIPGGEADYSAVSKYQQDHPNYDGFINGKPAGQPPTAAPSQLAEAIGARASKSGIESTADLPAPVATRAAELEAQGVPKGEALRQADIEGIGARPTVAHVKRTPGDMQALNEGAKLNTPEGNALSQQIADNNAAVHSKVQGMVEANGGTPAQGDAAQSAAQALAEASDAARAKVNEAYAAARAADGDKRVDIAALRETLDTPRFRASPIWNGLREQIKEMSKVNGGKFSPDEIDQLSQIVNDQYDPMGSGVNSMVGDLKGALNKSLDLFDNASGAFKRARALHRQWAEQYDDPAGVARLIRRDAKGNFLNEDNWRAAEGFVGTQSDKAFVQIARQLKATGNTEALGRLKASILQRAYEAASTGPADRMGNAVFNPRGWKDALNKIGKAKLNAVFSREEIADLAHVWRASSHMNEAIPGTANTSNSASSVINELDRRGAIPGKAKVAARVVGHGIAAITHPVVGNLAVEGLVNGAERAVGQRASARLASAMNEFMDPTAARAAEAQRITDELDAKRARELARALASFSAPQGGNNNGRSH